jgi:hypothetical protein
MRRGNGKWARPYVDEKQRSILSAVSTIMITKLPVQSGSDREGKGHLYLADLDALLPREIWHGVIPDGPLHVRFTPE